MQFSILKLRACGLLRNKRYINKLILLLLLLLLLLSSSAYDRESCFCLNLPWRHFQIFPIFKCPISFRFSSLTQKNIPMHEVLQKSLKNCAMQMVEWIPKFIKISVENHTFRGCSLFLRGFKATQLLHPHWLQFPLNHRGRRGTLETSGFSKAYYNKLCYSFQCMISPFYKRCHNNVMMNFV